MKFTYFLPTKLSFGYGSIDGLATEVEGLGAKRALVVTDKVMVKTGAAKKVTDRLGGLEADVYDGVEPEPSIEAAQAAGEAARSEGYDLVVGLGGGSSMDLAKVAAGLATNPGPARSYVGSNLFRKRPLPSVMIPTTAGTGAELTVTSMVTVEGHKQWINSPLLLPTVAIVDPDLTLSMPQSVTAATGMDALCHNVEAYFSGLASPITDSAALEGTALIVGNLQKAYVEGTDLRAREAMSLGALMGGIALQAKMVYGHSVGYTIATRFKLPHGVSCGLPLPYVIARYSVACGPKMKKLADAFGVQIETADATRLGLEVGRKAMELAADVGIPTSLKQLGVARQDLASLASECISLYPRPNSPLVFDEKSMNSFYEKMWEGNISG